MSINGFPTLFEIITAPVSWCPLGPQAQDAFLGASRNAVEANVNEFFVVIDEDEDGDTHVYAVNHEGAMRQWVVKADSHRDE